MSEGFGPVKQWILDQHPELTDIPDDMDLFEAGLLSSLQFVEFMVVIEDAGGREVDRRELDQEDFRTLGRIRRKFFPGAAEEEEEAPGNVPTAS